LETVVHQHIESVVAENLSNETIKSFANLRKFGRVVLATAVMMLPSSAITAETVPAGVENETVDEYLPEVVQKTLYEELTEGNPCSPGSLVRRGPTDKAQVAITYDDGPDRNAHLIMNAFDANGESGDAEFFLVGQNVLSNPEEAREIANRGFGISNHSMSHQYNPNIITSEILRAQQVIQSVTGVWPSYFRSPGLTMGSVIQQELARLNMCNVFADFDPHDWVSPRISANQICANILANAKPGSIILLHDGGTHTQTVLATETCLFPALRSLGLEVVSLNELLTGQEPIGNRIPANGILEIQAGQPNQTVIGQLTAVSPTNHGFLQAYPCEQGKPESSDLNYATGTTTANLLIVKLDSLGKFCVNTFSPSHILFDKVAEIAPEQLPSHAPVRKFDSRNGIGKIAGGSILRLQLAGPNEVVVGQLTSDRAEGSGFATVFKCDNEIPQTSNLNYVSGVVASNRYVTQANDKGEVCFYVTATTDIIVDQTAEMDTELPEGSLNFDAKRLLDTRHTSSLTADGIVKIQTGEANQTFVGQLTIDRAKSDGFATIYPCSSGLPNASNVNYTPSRPRSSSVVVRSDESGEVCAYVSAGADVIFDSFLNAPWNAQSPVRLTDTRNS
jgi:peptidoglycan/xylan/chitin deacetylase (PgdA/CDA1 family)